MSNEIDQKHQGAQTERRKTRDAAKEFASGYAYDGRPNEARKRAKRRDRVTVVAAIQGWAFFGIKSRTPFLSSMTPTEEGDIEGAPEAYFFSVVEDAISRQVGSTRKWHRYKAAPLELLLRRSLMDQFYRGVPRVESWPWPMGFVVLGQFVSLVEQCLREKPYSTAHD